MTFAILSPGTSGFIVIQFGLKINKTIETLELLIVDREAADKLNISIGEPCFELDTQAYLSDGTIIEYSKTIYRGDLAHFVIERNY
jgi:GntR family transcriptional regulator